MSFLFQSFWIEGGLDYTPFYNCATTVTVVFSASDHN